MLYLFSLSVSFIRSAFPVRLLLKKLDNVVDSDILVFASLDLCDRYVLVGNFA